MPEWALELAAGAAVIGALVGFLIGVYVATTPDD